MLLTVSKSIYSDAEREDASKESVGVCATVVTARERGRENERARGRKRERAQIEEAREKERVFESVRMVERAIEGER